VASLIFIWLLLIIDRIEEDAKINRWKNLENRCKEGLLEFVETGKSNDQLKNVKRRKRWKI
jgi:hypothetical protein